jgi:RNA polymerase sigma-70 factor (ECF subfamily)
VIHESETALGRSFPSTHWSVVLAAGRNAEGGGAAALAVVCEAYWHPLYAFARRLGYGPADAQDLTQGFFARLLAKPFLDRAEAAKGRFRSFLLGAFKNHLGKERERAGALKRGGGQGVLSLEVEAVEARYACELALDQSPERVFERAWAVSMLDEAMRRLGQECAERGRLELFQTLQPYLECDPEARAHAEVARALGTTAGTIRVTVNRMRRRYLEHLRAVLRQTVGGEAEVEDELRHLQSVLRGG